MALPSARPASFLLATHMTLPMSFEEEAPTSAMMAFTSDYALPAIGARSGLSPIRLCPCRANYNKEGTH